MDDFLSKPVVRDTLIECLRRHLPNRHTPAIAPPENSITDVNMTNPALQRILLLAEQLGLTNTLFFLEEFQRSALDFAEQLLQALQDDDWSTAQRMVHSIKGSSGTLGMDALSQQTAALERRIQAGPGAEPLAELHAAAKAFHGNLAQTVAAALAACRAHA